MSNETTTIQKTSKECKAAMLIGGASFFAGCVLIYIGSAESIASGAFLLVAGIIIHVTAKTVAWWNHR